MCIKRLVLFLAVAVGLGLATSAHAQPVCVPWWVATISVERGTASTEILVHTHAVFNISTFPYGRVVTRTGNQFTVTYETPPNGPSAISEFDDVVSLGTLPSGTYTVTGVFRNTASGALCPYASASFLVASSVPTLGPQAFAALCFAVVAAGCFLLRFRIGVGA
jgi:hypothetical protein